MDKATVGKALTAAIAAMAAFAVIDWSNVQSAVERMPALFQALSTGFPLGFWTFLLTLGMAMGLWGAIFIHPGVCKWRPHSCADAAAVLGGLILGVIQQSLAGSGGSVEMGRAILLSLFAGLLAMWLSRLAWSLFAPPKGPDK
jgi:hypothetical protein